MKFQNTLKGNQQHQLHNIFFIYEDATKLPWTGADLLNNFLAQLLYLYNL